MYIRRNIRWQMTFAFSWKYVIFYALYGTFWVWLFHRLSHEGYNISMPFLPMSVIGIAVALYVGFKNSQSYDRFWEARKIWGGIVNYSRTWTLQVLGFVTNRNAKNPLSDQELHELKKSLIYRHIGWMNALRLSLRKPSKFSIEHKGASKAIKEKLQDNPDWVNDVAVFMAEKECTLMEQVANVPTQIIKRQGDELRQLMERGHIEDFRHMEMMRVLEEFYNLQGKCERINNTPFPRQYAYFSKVFVWIYVLVLPLGLVGAFMDIEHGYEWLAVPFYVVISWIFMMMEQIGDYSEDPFEGGMNDVPMSAMCRSIETDLKQMLGETDIRPPVQPIHDILM